MTLPYDYARCEGRGWPECADCLRRLSPWRPDGNQVFIAPEHREAEGCEAAINSGGIDSRFIDGGESE